MYLYKDCTIYVYQAVDGLAGALKDSDPALRLAAAQALVRLEAPRRLLPAVADADSAVRGVAVEGMLALTLGGAVVAAAACGDMGLPLALVGALRPLLADPQRRLRHTAARALAAHGEPEWLEVFDKPDGPPCGAALVASALGVLAMELLVGLLTVPQPEDRKVAASTLGLRLDRGAAAALRVAARDPNAEVRAATVALLLLLATCYLLLAIFVSTLLYYLLGARAVALLTRRATRCNLGSHRPCRHRRPVGPSASCRGVRRLSAGRTIRRAVRGARTTTRRQRARARRRGWRPLSAPDD